MSVLPTFPFRLLDLTIFFLAQFFSIYFQHLQFTKQLQLATLLFSPFVNVLCNPRFADKKIYKCPWNAVTDLKSSFPYTSNAEIKTCVQSEVRQVLDDICFEKEKYSGKLSMKALGNMKYFTLPNNSSVDQLI